MRTAREAQGIAQDAFALIAGIDRSYYGKLERGERQPTIAVFLRVAGALQISGAELLSRAEALLVKARRRRSVAP